MKFTVVQTSKDHLRHLAIKGFHLSLCQAEIIHCLSPKTPPPHCLLCLNLARAFQDTTPLNAKS